MDKKWNEKKKKGYGFYIIALSFGLEVVAENILLRRLDFEHYYIYTRDSTTTTPYKILYYIIYFYSSLPYFLSRAQYNLM